MRTIWEKIRRLMKESKLCESFFLAIPALVIAFLLSGFGDFAGRVMDVVVELLGAFLLGAAYPVYRLWRSDNLQQMLAQGKAELVLAPILQVLELEDSRSNDLVYELDGERRKCRVLDGICADAVGCILPVYRYLDGSGRIKEDPEHINWSGKTESVH